MTLKHMFVMNAIISAFFGFALVFAPSAVGAFYGQHLNADGAVNTRMWGVAVLGYALITWLCRNAEESVTRQRIVLALFCYFTLGFAACIFDYWTEPQPFIAWTTPLLYLLLAFGYGYFHFLHHRWSDTTITLIGLPK